MKIKDIKTSIVTIPLKKPYILSKSIGTITHTSYNLIKIETDESMVGFGETNPMQRFSEETPETINIIINKYLKPKLIGENPLNIQNINNIMDETMKGNPHAKAAIDIACHDLFGKKTNLSLSSLLGGAIHTSLPLMGSIGGGSLQDNIKEAEELIRKGYSSLMIKVGSATIKEDIERVRAIRQALGKEFPLIVDANQGWNAQEAIAFARQVENCDISLLEQPVPAMNYEDLKKVKESISIPISADESLFSKYDALRLINMKAVDVFSIKVSKHGGIYKTKEIMKLAEAFHIPCLMNSMIEGGITQAASLHLGLSASGLYPFGHAYFSPTRLEMDITNYTEYISDGEVYKPILPGLGIELDENLAHQYIQEVNVYG
ncbi:mandelate racemase/muconate lactonizing enzyme family protein [Pontibacillus salicampi]|uniref:Mandelate racemase/muconate lactonizing enzyme family protein n=1 Tax=Pontibacillus salicampi TaxID=1449801 RepID=A0ABV6LQK0_9BACI